MRKLRKTFLLAVAAIAAAILPSSAEARVVAGSELPEQVKVGGRELTLNGAAVQKLLMFKVYAVGLYLENPTQSAKQAIEADEAKRIHLRVLKSASNKQIVGALREGMEKSGADMAALEGRLREVSRNIPDVKGGETLYITYMPGHGTELRGRNARVVIPGKDFADALFATWLGSDPGTRELRDRLLGRS